MFLSLKLRKSFGVSIVSFEFNKCISVRTQVLLGLTILKRTISVDAINAPISIPPTVQCYPTLSCPTLAYSAAVVHKKTIKHLVILIIWIWCFPYPYFQLYSWGHPVALGYKPNRGDNPIPRKISLTQGEAIYQEKNIINYKSGDSYLISLITRCLEPFPTFTTQERKRCVWITWWQKLQITCSYGHCCSQHDLDLVLSVFYHLFISYRENAPAQQYLNYCFEGNCLIYLSRHVLPVVL